MLPVVRWHIVADFLVLTVAFYALLCWARSARAMRIALSIVGLRALALLASRLDLVVTSWVLDAFAILLVLVLLLIFQPELRRAFMQLDSTLKLWPRPAMAGTHTGQAIANAAFALAQYQLGALMVITRRDAIGDLLEGGIAIGGELSAELLEAIFQKVSPLHDGAVVITGNRLLRAGVVMPLTKRQDVPSYYGTRHRAAVGLAERCDALVIAVSEERSEVTLMDGATTRHMEDPDAVRGDARRIAQPNPRKRGSSPAPLFPQEPRPQIRRTRPGCGDLGHVVSSFRRDHSNHQRSHRIQQCAPGNGSHQPIRRHARYPGPGKSLDHGLRQPQQIRRPLQPEQCSSRLAHLAVSTEHSRHASGHRRGSSHSRIHPCSSSSCRGSAVSRKVSSAPILAAVSLASRKHPAAKILPSKIDATPQGG